MQERVQQSIKSNSEHSKATLFHHFSGPFVPFFRVNWPQSELILFTFHPFNWKLLQMYRCSCKVDRSIDQIAMAHHFATIFHGWNKQKNAKETHINYSKLKLFCQKRNALSYSKKMKAKDRSWWQSAWEIKISDDNRRVSGFSPLQIKATA